MFNKQTPDFEKLHKKQREMILEMLRKGPNHLIRLRHPRLLTIDHPLEESKLGEREIEGGRERERECTFLYPCRLSFSCHVSFLFLTAIV